MNHLGRFGKGTDMVLRQAVDDIKRGHTNAVIKLIYRRYSAWIFDRYQLLKVYGMGRSYLGICPFLFSESNRPPTLVRPGNIL